jgi:hypothetical protein
MAPVAREETEAMSDPYAPLAAMIYGSGQGPEMDRILETLAHSLSAEGLQLAGAVQHTASVPSSPRCDMVLEDLGTGGIHPIAVDPGIDVQGCRMEPGKIETLAILAGEAVDRGADLFVLNRFGKNEIAGRGYREVISEAVSRGLPVLVGVSAANVAKWEAFASMGYDRLDIDGAAARAWCRKAVDTRRRQKEQSCLMKT